MADTIETLKADNQDLWRRIAEYSTLTKKQGETIDSQRAELDVYKSFIKKLNSWLLNYALNLPWEQPDQDQCVAHIKEMIHSKLPDANINVVSLSDFDRKRIQLENLDMMREEYAEKYKNKPELLNDVQNLLDDMKKGIIGIS